MQSPSEELEHATMHLRNPAHALGRFSTLKLTSYSEARRLTECAIRPLGSDLIDLDQAQGMTCATDIHSQVNMPDKTCSAMDGYAIHSSATLHASPDRPISFQIVERSPSLRLNSERPFRAYRVFTGDNLPDGCDCVLRIEHARIADTASGQTIVLNRPIEKWRDATPAGTDVAIGDLLCKKGSEITPARLSLLIGCGVIKIEVNRRPRVLIISVGTGLKKFSSVKEFDSQTDGKICNFANLVKGYLEELAFFEVRIQICDSASVAIQTAIEQNFKHYDAIITIGGSSVGPNDNVARTISSLGEGQILFHGLAVTPLKPSGVALKGNTPVIMLPSHAVSCAASFFMVALPVLNLLEGLHFEARHHTMLARSCNEIENIKAIPSITLVRLTREPSGTPAFRVLPSKSNVQSALAEATGFVIAEPQQTISKGEMAEVFLFGRTKMVEA